MSARIPTSHYEIDKSIESENNQKNESNGNVLKYVLRDVAGRVICQHQDIKCEKENDLPFGIYFREYIMVTGSVVIKEIIK